MRKLMNREFYAPKSSDLVENAGNVPVYIRKAGDSWRVFTSRGYFFLCRRIFLGDVVFGWVAVKKTTQFQKLEKDGDIDFKTRVCAIKALNAKPFSSEEKRKANRAAGPKVGTPFNAGVELFRL